MFDGKPIHSPVFVPTIVRESGDYWAAMLELMQSRLADGEWFRSHPASKDARKAGRQIVAWTETDLDNNRGISRALYDTNDYVTGLIDSLVNYTAGRGFQWTPYREGQEAVEYVADLPSELLGAKIALDAFKRRDRWRSRQREICKRGHRDGDAFVRMFRSHPGRPPAARFVEPELVTKPPGCDDEGPFSFGVLTHPDDIEKPLAYHIANLSNPGQGEIVFAGGLYRDEIEEAKELLDSLNVLIPIGPGVIFHFKCNVDRTTKRGTPTLIAAATGYQSATKLLRNVVDTAALQAAIYLLRQHVGGTQNSIQDFATNFATSGNVPIGSARGSIGGIIPRNIPAAAQTGPVTIDASDSINYLPGPVTTGTPNFLLAERAQIRRGGVRVNAPEFLATGDASNANFASTKEAGSPFVVATEGRQDDLADFEQDVAECVLRLSGDFPGVCVSVQAPPAAMRSDLESEQIRQIQHQAGVLSVTTWQKLAKLKPEVEQANFARERELNPDAGPMLPLDDDASGALDSLGRRIGKLAHPQR